MQFPNIASKLKSATTNVNIANASAPTTGQVLTATSSTAATWQTPTTNGTGGGGGSITDHNNLTNIQGGAAGDYQHLTTAQVTKLNNQSGVNTGDQTMNNGTPITATNGQTVCTTPTYVIGNNKLEVYLNGLLQEITQDYTETSTTSITFVSGLLAGDRVTYKLLS